MKRPFVISVLILACSLLVTLAEGASNASVSVIPTMNQLPERGLRRIFRDSEGYMWYGTTNGLCRDDGYHVAIFHPGNANNINGIAEDSIGRILVATDKGVWALDKRNYRISPLDEIRIGSRPVNSLHVTADGDVWINQYGKLRRYDRIGNWIKDYNIIDRKGKATYVSGFCQARSGEIFMTSYSRGIYRYEKDKDAFEMYRPIGLDVPLGQIVQDRRNDHFWVTDFRASLYRFDPDADSVFVQSTIHYWNSHRTENLLDFTQDDHDGYLWGISRNHLLVFRPEPDGTLTSINHPMADNFNGASMMSVLSTPGAIWVGCLDRASSVIYLDNNVVDYALPAVRGRYENSPVITAVLPADRRNLLWMLQFRSGLMLYDLANDRISYHDDNLAMDVLRLRMAEEMGASPSRNGVWVSQERSLMVYAITHTDMVMSKADSVSISSYVTPTAKITKLFEDSSERLWIGSTEGLFCFDLNLREFVGSYPDAGIISDIVEANDRRIYGLSKERGLIDVTSLKFKLLSKEVSFHNKNSAMATSPDGKIWIGTDDGRVYDYNPADRTFTDHTDRCSGLGQSGVKQMYVSEDGHVWAITDSKIVEFNPRNNLRFVYDAGKDTNLGRLLSRTPCRVGQGFLGVGGVGGIAVFSSNPALDEDATSVKTVITDITVSGESRVLEADGDMFDDGQLTLNPDDRNIEFHFATLGYRYPTKMRYAYRIKGFDKEWRYTAMGENIAVYNGFSRGSYTLEVRACDEYDRLSGELTTLEIKRLPHFYESWWAFLIYFLLLLLSVGYVLVLYRRRLKKQNEELWADSEEMIKMRSYLSSPVTLPEEEFQKLDRILLEKATKVVEDNLNDSDFDVNALARGVNMSRSTFSRKIKSITGKTPLDFILEIKMQHACKLLESKNYSISQVADMVGYGDRRYFTTSFKKEIGISPRDYQNGMRANKNEEDEK